MPSRVSLINLGCPKNLVDAEVMLGHMWARGFELTGDISRADVVVVNTCGFLQASVQESVETLQAVSRLKREGHCQAVIAVGCMAQRFRAEAADALPQVDGFLGVGQGHELPALLDRVLKGARELAVRGPAAGFEGYRLRCRATPSWTAYVKVSEGCDRHCAFCTIPAIRGPMECRPIPAVVREVETLVANGVREVILIGQDPTRYGVDLGIGHQLPQLLERLNEIRHLRWIRLMYLFPDRHVWPILKAMAALPRVCKYVDMPFQHVSAAVLRGMNRPGDGQEFLRLLEKLRSACPEVFVRSTFIVGFPGETDARYRELEDFLRAARLEWVGAFQYSREQETPAASRRQVPRRVKAERYHRLMALQQEITAEALARRVGSRAEAVIERLEPKGAVGRIYGQAPEIDGETYLHLARVPDVQPGDFIEVEITGVEVYDLRARVLRRIHRPPSPAADLLQIAV
ncbi:MAG: 30S ribosomal protein S12 methylthiotransferase RimO [Armatimonadetes bacterium]|nr:30S ribosomal protein S12 methylthiotransferase RimO [Armatimonadota bacterium]